MINQKRIIIARPDRIGDVVLSTPLPREIKKQFPDSFIAVLVKKYTSAIYQNNPYVDLILTDDFNQGNKRQTFWRLVKKLRKYKFTHAFMLLPTERLNWLFFFSGIHTRIGVGNKFYQFITNTKSVSRNKYIPLKSEADYCMDIARKIGVESNNINTEIFLTETEREKLKEIRASILKDAKFIIGIHTTSGNSAPNWEIVEYKKLLLKLRKISDIKIVITDNYIPEQIKNIEGIFYINENLPLRKAIVNFAALDYLISASTGPMHIAAALKIKTISLFCTMTACSPQLWGPQGNISYIMTPTENYCKTKCPGDPKKCMLTGEGGVNADDVYIKGIG